MSERCVIGLRKPMTVSCRDSAWRWRGSVLARHPWVVRNRPTHAEQRSNREPVERSL